MAFSTKKRFIAGVVCPKCSQVDKIRVFSEGDVDYRECVSCGFKDQIRMASAPREIDTRVNKSAEAVSEQPRKIRLIDTDKTK